MKTKGKVIGFVVILLILAGIIYVSFTLLGQGELESDELAGKAGTQLIGDEENIAAIIIDNIFDNLIALTIVIIFLTAIIKAFVTQRSRDKCLKDFRDFHVTFKMNNGKTIWGTLNLYSTGLELEYKKPYYDEKEDIYKYSYIISKQEFEPNIAAIHRYHWDLTPRNKKKRDRSIKITHKPNIFRSFGRSIRNSVNTLNDAFKKSLNLIIGQIGSKVAKGGTTGELKSIGSSLLGMVGHAYDSVLEKYIGRKVIAEINEDNEKHEYEGILKEYTTKYIELLNVKYDFYFTIDVSKLAGNDEYSKIKFIKKDNNSILEIDNSTPIELEFVAIESASLEGDKKNINKVLMPEEKLNFNLDKYKEITDLKLIFKTIRYVDIITPRFSLTIRHSGKREKLSIKEMLGLDDISLSFIKKEK